jgi:hypothetical protein
MSQREVHILSERQRRKSMRESFCVLQSLIPKLKLKVRGEEEEEEEEEFLLLSSFFFCFCFCF